MAKRDFLLIHGGMHGGWCWRRVMPFLFEAGHYAVAPTLTGLGHRARLGSAATNLQTHIEDVIACIEMEEMQDFVLVGHSYAGMVVTGVADRIGSRIARLVYLDALTPENGETASDVVGGGQRADFSAVPDGMARPMPGYDFGLTNEDDKEWVRRRCTPQSVATLTQPVSITSDLSLIPRTFIECVEERDGAVLMAGIAARAARIAIDPAWNHVALRAGHDCMISHPRETAEILLSLAC